MADTTTDQQQQLVPVKPEVLKKDLAIQDPTKIQAVAGSEGDLDKKADEFVEALLKLNPADVEKKAQGKESVEAMGLELQKEAARQSELLKRPLADLSKKSEDGGQVAKSLIDLKMQVEQLDPGKLDLQAGWFSRALGRLPGVGTPVKRYFSKYESAQTVISAIIRSLENGRDQLQRDNVTMGEDQKRMQQLAVKLERAIKLAQLIDQKLEYKMTRETEAGSPQQKFIGEELLFPLRQRVMDLQQQLAVHQQGVLATELIMRNNQELVRGVNRALNVTVNALQVAVTVAMALENQKIVLDKIDAINQTTSGLIAGTAQRLKTQGVQIHQRAASTMLDMNALKSAFADVNTALEDLSKFRMAALPQMASSVLELDQLNNNVKQAIDRMEQGKKKRPEITVDIG